MKKHIVMAMMALATLTAGAQGVWTTGMTEGDELKGTVSEPFYRYDVAGMGTFVSWTWEDANFRLISEYPFEAWERTVVYANGNQVRTGECFVNVTAGLYSKDGKLEKKYDLEMYVEDNSSNKQIKTYGYMVLGRGKLRKIISKIRSGEGYVRFVAGRAGMSDFDLIVTPYTGQ